MHARIVSERLASQGLGTSAPTLDELVSSLVSVQAQVLSAAQLSLRARMPALTTARITDALATGDLVVSWLNRGTLHLVRREDFWLLQHATSAARVRTLRSRFRIDGVTPERVETISAVLVNALSSGSHSKADVLPLMELDSFDVAPARRTIVAANFLEQLSATGHLVRGPVLNGEVQYVAAESWVGPNPGATDLTAALAHLASRFAVAHWPASAEDFATWLGIGLTPARGAWAAAGLDTTHQEVERIDWTGLLGPFDPTLHGWTDRTWLLGEYVPRIISTNGVFRSSIIVHNRCVGTWKLDKGSVRLDYFEPVGSSEAALIDADAHAIERFSAQAAEPG